MKNLTTAQKETLINKGFDSTLFEVLSNEELHQLLIASEKESLVIRLQKTRVNVCTQLVELFSNEPEVTYTKQALAEAVRMINQTSFFTIKKDGQPFNLTNSNHVKTFMLLPTYKFSNERTNKQVDAAPIEADKVKIAVGQWLSRGKNIVNEILNPKHAKFFNGYKLDYTCSVDGENVTFKRA